MNVIHEYEVMKMENKIKIIKKIKKIKRRLEPKLKPPLGQNPPSAGHPTAEFSGRDGARREPTPLSSWMAGRSPQRYRASPRRIMILLAAVAVQ
jgi:hypothetical protein